MNSFMEEILKARIYPHGTGCTGPLSLVDVRHALYRTPLPDGGHKTVIKPSKAGALSGAAAGAALGSIIPGVGTTVGAAIGGTIGFIFGPAD